MKTLSSRTFILFVVMNPLMRIVFVVAIYMFWYLFEEIHALIETIEGIMDVID